MYEVRNAGGETLARFVVLDSALARAKRESQKAPVWFAVYDGPHRRAIAIEGRVEWLEECKTCQGHGKVGMSVWADGCNHCEGTGQIRGEIWT